MTKIKLCGLSRPCDIEAANEIMPEYIGFVFAKKSRRCVTAEQAKELKKMLNPRIKAVGVFVNEPAAQVAALLEQGIIDIAQLHGQENDDYIKELRLLTQKPIMQAFRIQTRADIEAAQSSTADDILLDSGAGTGSVFDWELIRGVSRPYFLAGGLSPENAAAAVRQLAPYAVDVSSGIETEGKKDKQKMAAFAAAVRKEDAI